MSSAVQSDDVVRVAERYLDPARTVTLVVGDYQAVGPSLGPLGLGEPQAACRPTPEQRGRSRFATSAYRFLRRNCVSTYPSRNLNGAMPVL